MAKIYFTDHAKQQLKERHLNEKSVVAIITKPESTKKQADGRLKIIGTLTKKPKLFLLVIIAEKTDHTLTIVTVFKTSKVKKYL